MALTAYETQVQLLLNDTGAQLYQTSDLRTWINEGRQQLAIASEILISTVTESLPANGGNFPLSALTPISGYQNAVNIRSMSATVSGQRRLMEERPWQWFLSYYYTGPNSLLTGPPAVWAQQSQGVSGTAFVWKTADQIYQLQVEATWTPVALVDDSTLEVIPYPWTDAIPFYGAYRALMFAQRLDDAQKMFQAFQRYVLAARLGVTPETLPDTFPTTKPLPGAIDPNLSLMAGAQPAKMGEGTV